MLILIVEGKKIPMGEQMMTFQMSPKSMGLDDPSFLDIFVLVLQQ